MNKRTDICIVGGAGHVGLPLGLAFADKGLGVVLYDSNSELLSEIQEGKVPFSEENAETILRRVINKNLWVSSDIKSVGQAKYIIIAIGTPVDDHLNPNLKVLIELFNKLKPYISKKQIIIIRSTVYPRTCRQIADLLQQTDHGLWHIAYCPERIVQGKAIVELAELPQIVSGLSKKAIKDATVLFKKISPSVVRVSVEEAELAKLFSNAWRYIQFGVANQFYMIASEFGVDFNRVRKAMVEGYGRASNLPTAGFAAGPCLLKDTLQLSAFNNSKFTIGNVAVMVNEGMPNFIVENLSKTHDLAKTRVGILGMAFKADIDDIRDSLSYKLGKILRFHGATVYYSDEYAKDPTFISKEKLMTTCDVVIIGVPHRRYRNLAFPKEVKVIDMWGIIKKSTKIKNSNII